MAHSVPAAARSTRPVSYRALGIFWAAVLVVVVAGGVTLQVLGPVTGPRGNRAVAPPGGASAGGASAGGASAGVVAGQSGAERAAAGQAGSEEAGPRQPAPPAPPRIAPPNPAMLEPAPDYPDRMVPKVAGDNPASWPSTVYAAPFNAADKNPRIALVVTGAGLDSDLTLHLLQDTPPMVDVAFSAYMPPDRAAAMAQAARDTAHECLLSIPMESAGQPSVEDGSHQLAFGATEEQYREGFSWALSRLGGCVGAVGAGDNGMRGDHFAQDPFFKTLLIDVTSRGLLYLDPLTHVSLLYPAGTDAPALEPPGRIDLVRKADVVIDENIYNDSLHPEEIRANLATLEKTATLDRPAIGIAVHLNPALVDIIRDWARGLPGRGMTLVPLSATPKMPPPSPVVVIPDPNAAK